MVLPPLCLLLFGTVEIARLMWARMAITEIAATTARCLAVRAAPCATAGLADTAKAAAYAQARAAGFSIMLPDGSVSALSGVSCAGVSGFATVSITAEFSNAMPLIAAALGTTRMLSASACFPARP